MNIHVIFTVPVCGRQLETRNVILKEIGMSQFHGRGLWKMLRIVGLLIVMALPAHARAQGRDSLPVSPWPCLPKTSGGPGIPGLLTCPISGPSTVAALPKFNIDIQQTSVSGISSGGFMAVQFDVAFSSIMKGAGIIAGGPYFCSHGDANVATTKCSCTGLTGTCQVTPGGTGVNDLIKITDDNARRGVIDATSNLSGQKIWLFSGTKDSVVPPAVMKDLEKYYQHFIGSSGGISFVNTVPSEHAMPTDFFGNPCSTKGSPYINNCGFDAAGLLLKFIYGSGLNPRNTGTLSGKVIEFDQSEFFGDRSPTKHGMAQSGFAYVPASCDSSGTTTAPCKLHVVFHGCLQDQSNLRPRDTYVKNTGYNQWADTNNVIVLYPQAAPLLFNAFFMLANPNGCWNFWNFEGDDTNFATRTGREMVAVKSMIDRIAGH